MKKHLMLLLMLSWTFPSVAATKVKQKCVGVASIYSKHFNGRRQANGCKFDSRKLTAANRWLPLGSHIRVFNPANQRYVDVEITDRGPWVRGRVLDLSPAAAQRLDMVRKGVARVIYTVLPETVPMTVTGEL